MQIINKQAEFQRMCDQLSQEPIIFMDTEFDRRRTYYAKLSLIQIATPGSKIIVDALSINDITPIKDVLLNEKICKVFHAPDQDLDIFYHLFGKLPKNIFDTQIAAGVIGLDEVMGYGKLCKALLDVNIDKTMQNANWMERPLTKALLDYAIKDVEYLIPLYRELSGALNSRKLWDTYKTRSSKHLEVDTYRPCPEKFLKKAGLQDQSNNFKNKYSHLAMLREECAKDLNVPRGYCASDRDLITICESLPITSKDLFKLQIEHLPIAKKHFREKLLALCLGLRE